MKRADGTGEDEWLLSRAPNLVDLRASDWSPDGTGLRFSEVDPQIRIAFGQTPIERESEPQMLVQDDFYNDYPSVSSDGRWIAYESDRSGRFEVYVERYPDLGDREQISTEGGRLPLWSQNGREHFFSALDGRRVLAVPVQSGARLVAGRPEVVFEGSYLVATTGFRLCDVAPDGRFVMISLDDAGSGAVPAPGVVLVQNWFQELERLVPGR
jgi:serine/threonine-protein kinase